MATVIAIAGGVVGIVGIAFGLRCYVELHRWARQCQNARIVVARKRRVQLNAPLTEWLTWANALSKDESATGRVVYHFDKTSVAILRPDTGKTGGRIGSRLLAHVLPRKDKAHAG